MLLFEGSEIRSLECICSSNSSNPNNELHPSDRPSALRNTSPPLPSPAQTSDMPSPSTPIGYFTQRSEHIFSYIKQDRLKDARFMLLELSNWLVTSAGDLGLGHDTDLLYRRRLWVWEEFNNAWLALLQRQQELSLSDADHPGLITLPMLKHMGNELVRLADMMEPHGLVDYEFGIWENSIMDALTTCCDLAAVTQRRHNTPAVLPSQHPE